MIKKQNYFLLFILSIVFIASCQTIKSDNENNQEDSRNPRFANRFSLIEYPEYTIVSVNQPEQEGSRQLHYLLYSETLPTTIDTLIPIKVPIQSMASNSTTHLAFLELLDETNRLTGFAQSQYIYSPIQRKRADDGQIVELGRDAFLDVETVVQLNPDILMASFTGFENKQLLKLQELGIKVVMNADYMENSVLGRAEWVKFAGHFLGKSKQANMYFDQLVLRYDSLKLLTANSTKRPSVFSGNLYGGTWYMPGGKNYNAALINDAGGNYLWSENEQSGGLNLDFEMVFVRCWQADLWIGASNFESLADMLVSDSRYADFEAFKAGQVYTYTARVNEMGANDYFESGSIYPDRLLADHIKIIHPELLPTYELYYYKKLK